MSDWIRKTYKGFPKQHNEIHKFFRTVIKIFVFEDLKI